MPTNRQYLAPLDPGQMYHICNRTNHDTLLFRSDENRRFFLQQFDLYLSHLLDIYAWCLLSNHFHFQVQMKTEEYAYDHLLRVPPEHQTITQMRFLAGETDFNDLAVKAFKQFFISYSLAYCNQYRLKGNLFYREFKRVFIEDEHQFKNTMLYIHTNPVKHGITEDFRDYKWSSWSEYEVRKYSKINREVVYGIFGNKTGFLSAHIQHQEFLSQKILYPV